MSEKKETRRKAIRHIASRDCVSFAVASQKISGMDKKSRKRLYTFVERNP